MTIIVFDPASDKIYSDSRSTFSDGRAPLTLTKVERIDASHVGAYCSSGAVPANIVNNLIEKALRTPSGIHQHGLAGMDLVHGFVRNTVTKDVYVIKSNESQIFVAPAERSWIQPCGSGGDWFNAYLEANPERDVHKAITMTAKHHSQCGLPVDVF